MHKTCILKYSKQYCDSDEDHYISIFCPLSSEVCESKMYLQLLFTFCYSGLRLSVIILESIQVNI